MINFLIPIALIAAVTVLVLFFNWMKGPSNFPPGPSLPSFIYSLMNTPLHEALDEIGKKYGPIVSLPTGSMKTIYIQDFDLAVDTIVNATDEVMGRCFAGKFPLDFAGYTTQEESDMSFLLNYNPVWEDHKKIVSFYFENIQHKDKNLEKKIQEENQHLMDVFRSHGNRSFNPDIHVALSTANIIFISCLGKRFDYADKKFTDVVSELDQIFHMKTISGLHPGLIILRYLPFSFSIWKTRKNYERSKAFLKDYVSDLRRKYNSKAENNLVNAFLAEKERRKNTGKPHDTINEAYLTQYVMDMYIAGKFTNTSALMWVYLYMIARPDVQTKVQKEIDEVIGKDRLPSYDDKQRMPVTMSTILEVLRIACVLTFGLPRKTTADIDISGFKIPKDTTVLISLYSIHHDDRQFKNSKSFVYNRFIKDGKCIEDDIHIRPTVPFVAYSSGKRCCIGLFLSKMHLFLNLTTVLQKYSLVNPTGQTLNLHRGGDLIGGCPDFNMQLIKRLQT